MTEKEHEIKYVRIGCKLSDNFQTFTSEMETEIKTTDPDKIIEIKATLFQQCMKECLAQIKVYKALILFEKEGINQKANDKATESKPEELKLEV